MTRRALVLGAGGFLGSHLSRYLLERGWSVTGLVRDADAPYVLRRLEHIRADMTLVEGGAGDEAVLDTLVADCDAVFPFAGRSGAARSMASPLLDLAGNGASQLALLESLRRHAPHARTVFPGSRLQYGRVVELPVVEETPTAPVSIYGVHKALGESYHLLYARVYGVQTCSLRISNPYGPGQDRPDHAFGVVGTFLATAARGETLRLYGGGHQLRDYIYVRDLCRLFELAVTRPEAVGQVFNASGAAATSLRQMAETVVSVVGSGDIADAPWPADDATVETGDYVGSSAKATTVLGWRATTPLAEGLARTWADLSTHLAGSR